MTFTRPSTTRSAFALAATVLAVAFAQPAFADPPINTLRPGVLGGRGDVAIQGYDTVAYFKEAKPVLGRDEFTAEWKGAKWKFASQANLDDFKADPAKFAPQYGGYCAYGTSQDHLVKIEPSAFKIIDGKLYLNYDAKVQAIWAKDPATYIKLADTKYPELSKP